jgi:hypothetical protein
VISCHQETIHLHREEEKEKKQADNFIEHTERELEECCIKFANTFSYDDSSPVVELYDLISELKIMKYTLPDGTLSDIEISQHTRHMDCYPTTFLSNLI